MHVSKDDVKDLMEEVLECRGSEEDIRDVFGELQKKVDKVEEVEVNEELDIWTTAFIKVVNKEGKEFGGELLGEFKWVGRNTLANCMEIDFGECREWIGWGIVNRGRVYDQSGELMFEFMFRPERVVETGDNVRIARGDLKIHIGE